MSFIRRVFGRTGQDGEVAGIPAGIPEEVVPPDGISEVPPEPVAPEPVATAPVIRAACPTCGYPLDPPPERNRRCPSCREQIIVRRTEGRLVFLTEQAVLIFDRERQRIADEHRWTTERDMWLALATTVGAAPARRAQIATAAISEESVDASRQLYMTAAEDAVRKAKGAKRWSDVARIRRAEAAALFREAGSPIPPTEDSVTLHREGMIAELRALAVDYKDAELVGAGCCRPCRVGEGKAFKIADEIRTPRLPHEGCPKGLCACEWWLAMPGPKSRRRTRRTTSTPPIEQPAGESQGESAAPSEESGPS